MADTNIGKVCLSPTTLSLVAIYNGEAEGCKKAGKDTKIVAGLRNIDKNNNNYIAGNELNDPGLEALAFRFSLNILEVETMGQSLIGFNTKQHGAPAILKVIAGTDNKIDADELSTYIKNTNTVPLGSQHPIKQAIDDREPVGLIAGGGAGVLYVLISSGPSLLIGLALAAVGAIVDALHGAYKGVSAGSDYGLDPDEDYFEEPKTPLETTNTLPSTVTWGMDTKLKLIDTDNKERKR